MHIKGLVGVRNYGNENRERTERTKETEEKKKSEERRVTGTNSKVIGNTNTID